jgi:hypothetical protein
MVAAGFEAKEPGVIRKLLSDLSLISSDPFEY